MSETMPAPHAAPPPPPPAPTHHSVSKPTLAQIFVAFAMIAACGFGGVLYWSRRMLVEKRRWLTPEEFNESYALCNFLPGPNLINFCVVFGRQVRGAAGACAALAGLVGPPFVLMTFIAFLYSYTSAAEPLQRMFAGIAAAGVGLTISTSIQMVQPMLAGRTLIAPALAIAVLFGVGIMRWPLYWVLAVLIPVAIALSWWQWRRSRAAALAAGTEAAP
jgi:chromate transporter